MDMILKIFNQTQLFLIFKLKNQEIKIIFIKDNKYKIKYYNLIKIYNKRLILF